MASVASTPLIAFTVALIGVAAFAYLLIPLLVDEVTSFGHHTPELLQKLTRDDSRFGFLERRFHVVEHARDWIAQRGAQWCSRSRRSTLPEVS